jgi:hypothetical protein
MKNTKLKNGMYVIAPDDYSGLTKGKKYQVIEPRVSINELVKYNFKIIDDKGNELYCLLKFCRHLGGGNWIISNE